MRLENSLFVGFQVFFYVKIQIWLLSPTTKTERCARSLYVVHPALGKRAQYVQDFNGNSYMSALRVAYVINPI